MATKNHQSELVYLENYRISLTNAVNHPKISVLMSEMGYDKARIQEGQAKYDAVVLMRSQRHEDDTDRAQAHHAFDSLYKALDKQYRVDRKKARVVFAKEPLTLDALMVSSPIPCPYVDWILITKTFYTGLTKNNDLLKKMSRLKFSEKDAQTALKGITDLETLRSQYIQEKGESQVTTQKKKEAFAALDEWMSEFYAVARIALEDNPQLLEVLSKPVLGKKAAKVELTQTNGESVKK